MSSNGVRTRAFAICLFLISPILLSEDFGIHLPGMAPDLDAESSSGPKSTKSAFVLGASELPKSYEKQSSDTFIFAKENKKSSEVTQRDKINSSGYVLPGTYDNRENIVRTLDSSTYKEIKDQGKDTYSFVYIYDNYAVSDSRGAYRKTYESGSDSIQAGYVHIAYDKFIWDLGAIKAGYNFGIGVGYSQGYGTFSGGTNSTTRFKLFTVPIDFGLAISAFSGKYLSMTLAGGPSVMAINQNRDDREVGDSDKDIRQISPGFYGNAKLKLSLTALYPSLSFEMFKSYSITNSYVSLDIRYQNYASFADNFSISGPSFGLGFSFDYY